MSMVVSTMPVPGLNEPTTAYSSFIIIEPHGTNVDIRGLVRNLEPPWEAIERFHREAKAAMHAAKVAYRASREREVTSLRRGTQGLAERQYHRPLRKGRAVGRAHAVRL